MSQTIFFLSEQSEKRALEVKCPNFVNKLSILNPITVVLG